MSGDEVDPEYEVAVINSEDEVSGGTITYFEEITVEDPSCVICMRILFNAVVLGCGHGFCYRCFVRNFNVHRFCAECRFHVHYRPRICYLLYFLVMGLYRDVYESRLNHCQKIERIKGKVPRIDFRRKDQFDHLLRLRRDELNAADFKCTACLKLLFQPIALHCGHDVPRRIFGEDCFSSRSSSSFDNGTAFEVSSEEEVGTSEEGTSEEEVYEFNFPDGVVTREMWLDMIPEMLCDICGVFPIRCLQYTCFECQEVGEPFDVCEECVACPFDDLPGFSRQPHSGKHHLVLLVPRGFRFPDDNVTDDDL
ncbi:hypothetical protein ACS0TY_004680 [Phlomoides rotata]